MGNKNNFEQPIRTKIKKERGSVYENEELKNGIISEIN